MFGDAVGMWGVKHVLNASNVFDNLVHVRKPSLCKKVMTRYERKDNHNLGLFYVCERCWSCKSEIRNRLFLRCSIDRESALFGFNSRMSKN